MINIRFVHRSDRRSRPTTSAARPASAAQRVGALRHLSRRALGPRVCSAATLVLATLVTAIALSACDKEPADSPDGGSLDGATPEIWATVGGSGDTGKGFIDWSDGKATPPMIRGPQGGQHVWVMVRMRGMSPKKLKMTVEMRRIDSGKVVKPGAVPVMATVKTPAEFPSGFQSNAITAFVKCPCQVANRPLKVRLTLADLYGRTFETESTITPTWDGDCTLPPSASCADQ